MEDEARYNIIGHGYSRFRQEDPRLRERLRLALGDVRSVVNVGAGTGLYEPSDCYVLALEPSEVMAVQRPPEKVPALRITAGSLPLHDRSVDAAMALLTIHHWDDQLERGVREMRRVARKRVVLLTFDAEVSGAWWLTRDYFPEIDRMDRKIFPDLGLLASWLGRTTTVETIPLPRDTKDWTLGSYWAHPLRVLDPEARAATSGFARLDSASLSRGVERLKADLEDGSWEEKYGRHLPPDCYDVGLRLVVTEIG